LDDLKDSPNLDIVRQFLPQARLHLLTGNRKGQYAMDLKHPKRLIITPDHDPLPELPDGGTDLGKVTKVLVIEIEDYH
jgi:proteic killer suppression protein